MTGGLFPLLRSAAAAEIARHFGTPDPSADTLGPQVRADAPQTSSPAAQSLRMPSPVLPEAAPRPQGLIAIGLASLAPPRMVPSQLVSQPLPAVLAPSPKPSGAAPPPPLPGPAPAPSQNSPLPRQAGGTGAALPVAPIAGRTGAAVPVAESVATDVPPSATAPDAGADQPAARAGGADPALLRTTGGAMARPATLMPVGPVATQGLTQAQTDAASALTGQVPVAPTGPAAPVATTGLAASATGLADPGVIHGRTTGLVPAVPVVAEAFAVSRPQTQSPTLAPSHAAGTSALPAFVQPERALPDAAPSSLADPQPTSPRAQMETPASRPAPEENPAPVRIDPPVFADPVAPRTPTALPLSSAIMAPAIAEALATGGFPLTVAGQGASAASLVIFNAAMIPSWPPALYPDAPEQFEAALRAGGAAMAQMTPEEAAEYLSKMAAAFGFLLTVKKRLTKSLKEEKETLLGLFSFLGVALETLSRGLQMALDLTAEQREMLEQLALVQSDSGGRPPHRGRQRLRL